MYELEEYTVSIGEKGSVGYEKTAYYHVDYAIVPLFLADTQTNNFEKLGALRLSSLKSN